jgi:hypothetical protein
LSSSDRYEPHPERSAGEIIEGEAVVINLATGVYYSFGGVAGTIWRMVTERFDVRAMAAELTASYDVEAADAERDVRRVLDLLVEEGVIRPAAAGALAEPRTPAARAPYVSPVVEIYRDMQDLLALDPPSPGLNGVVWKSSTDPV